MILIEKKNIFFAYNRLAEAKLYLQIKWLFISFTLSSCVHLFRYACIAISVCAPRPCILYMTRHTRHTFDSRMDNHEQIYEMHIVTCIAPYQNHISFACDASVKILEHHDRIPNLWNIIFIIIQLLHIRHDCKLKVWHCIWGNSFNYIINTFYIKIRFVLNDASQSALDA